MALHLVEMVESNAFILGFIVGGVVCTFASIATYASCKKRNKNAKIS